MAKPTSAQITALIANPSATIADLDVLITDSSDATNVNCTDVTRCKNCNSCTRCSDCSNSTGCADCVNVDNSKRCTYCRNMGQSYDCSNCQGTLANKAAKLYRCAACLECNRCIGVVSGRGLTNVVCGVQLTAAQFATLWALVDAANV